MNAVFSRTPDGAQHLRYEVGDEYGAGPHLRSHARGHNRRAGNGPQPDFLPIADTEVPGVRLADLHEAVRIIQQQNAIFPFKCFTVLNQNIAMPVVKGVAENQAEWPLRAGFRGRDLRGGRKPEWLLSIPILKQKAGAQGTFLGYTAIAWP